MSSDHTALLAYIESRAQLRLPRDVQLREVERLILDVSSHEGASRADAELLDVLREIRVDLITHINAGESE